MEFLIKVARESWHIFEDASLYMLFGIAAAGLLKAFIKPDFVHKHLGGGRVKSVFKAALVGIPLPLCSCGVLPAAAGLKKQGANNGATTSFLISTPESGVDSIAISYALLDPILTIMRPVSGFLTALVAGVLNNTGPDWQSKPASQPEPLGSHCSSGCCSEHEHEHRDLAESKSVLQKTIHGLRYSYTDLWAELVPWFVTGVLLAGFITALVPTEVMSEYLGGGLGSMLIMLCVGIPLYICATASTPIAAALILKGVSPGAALVFLLAGPATNVTSLAMLIKVLGKRGVVVYLASIAVMSVLLGLGVDWVYSSLGLEAAANIGAASEVAPDWLRYASAGIMAAISIGPLWRWLKARFTGGGHSHGHSKGGGCGCGGHCEV